MKVTSLGPTAQALGLLALLGQTAVAVDPDVKLDYATYKGDAKLNGVTQWLGLRYAAPPTKEHRFAAPRDPEKETETIHADKFGPLCLATKSDQLTSKTRSEDCLNLNVFAPTKAKPDSKLPVYFFVQGGGFNELDNANYNGSGLIKASGDNIVVVNFNYRVGPYGFLASEEVLKGGSTNNGLKDQRKALEWVNKHIDKFGGDPGHVVLGGDSAGAASVTLQLTAKGGLDEHLFHATAAESQSFAPINTVPEAQYQYDALVKRASCDNKPNTLDCLRALSADDLQKININVAAPGQSAAPHYMYSPVLDKDFITDYTYAAYTKGNFVKVPAIYGDDTNEGTIFAPDDGTLKTIDDSNKWINTQFPALKKEQLTIIDKFFPLDTAKIPDQENNKYWRQCANAYGEIRYVCPGIYLNGIYANNSIAAWNYRWNVIDPPSEADGKGVTHTIEINAIWGPDNVHNAPESYHEGQKNYPIVDVVQGYWTSFIRSYDPNTHRAKGTPTWEQWTKHNSYARLKFETGDTKMETVPAEQQTRCAWLNSIGVELKQ